MSTDITSSGWTRWASTGAAGPVCAVVSSGMHLGATRTGVGRHRPPVTMSLDRDAVRSVRSTG